MFKKLFGTIKAYGIDELIEMGDKEADTLWDVLEINLIKDELDFNSDVASHCENSVKSDKLVRPVFSLTPFRYELLHKYKQTVREVATDYMKKKSAYMEQVNHELEGLGIAPYKSKGE